MQLFKALGRCAGSDAAKLSNNLPAAAGALRRGFADDASLLKTPLYDFHVAHGGARVGVVGGGGGGGAARAGRGASELRIARTGCFHSSYSHCQLFILSAEEQQLTPARKPAPAPAPPALSAEPLVFLAACVYVPAAPHLHTPPSHPQSSPCRQDGSLCGMVDAHPVQGQHHGVDAALPQPCLALRRRPHVRTDAQGALLGSARMYGGALCTVRCRGRCWKPACRCFAATLCWWRYTTKRCRSLSALSCVV